MHSRIKERQDFYRLRYTICGITTMAINFFNLHTHYSAKKNDETAIISFNIADKCKITDKIQYFSIGIHPWFIEKETLKDDLMAIANFAKQKNCVAIGECGLDRLKGEPLDVQIKVFTQQIEIANFAEKPLIIHCVRAFSELIAIKNEYKKTKTWIVHGFNGSFEIAEQLIKHNIYISFGANLRSSQKLQQILTEIPANRFFIETDVGDTPIEDIYQFAANLKNISVNDLRKQLSLNAKSIIFS